MKAIILAAGRGSRMKNLTDERPKCLVKLHGKSLLDWQLEALRAAGISEIAIVTGYKRELLANMSLIEFHNPRWAETNMVSSLACAQEWLTTGPCIVSYSDIFYDPGAVLDLINCTADLAITFDQNWHVHWKSRFDNPLIDAESFRITSENILIEIGNTPKSVKEVEGQYMGLLKITPEGWTEIIHIRDGLNQEQKDKMHMTGTLQKVIDGHRLQISAIPYFGNWGEIDSAHDLRVYQMQLFQEPKNIEWL